MRRLAFGLLGITAAAITIAGCASGGSSQTLSIGPSFAPQTLYATNATQNGIAIYNVGGTGSAPAYEISTGGSTSGLNGPQYIAFDTASNLYATNWQQSGSAGSIVEIKAAATGNVVPYNAVPLTPLHPRGIADFSFSYAGSATPIDSMVVAIVDPTQPLNFASQLQLFSAGGLLPIERIGGPNTGLNVPSGVAVDKSQKIYVTNLQGASVEVFALPSPSPTPSPTATPSPTPSPTPTPTGATPSPTPTVAPTATPVNIAPVVTIAGGTTSIGRPSGIAIDTNGNVVVSDQAAKVSACAPAASCPAILVFNAASVGANYSGSPSNVIAGSATKLVAPTDVKVDGSGNIFVADTTTSGGGVVYEFAAGSTGNVAPSATYTSTGAVIGLGFTP